MDILGNVSLSDENGNTKYIESRESFGEIVTTGILYEDGTISSGSGIPLSPEGTPLQAGIGPVDAFNAVGSDEPTGQHLMVVNAVDGSVIDLNKGY